MTTGHAHHRNGELQARVNRLIAIAEARGVVDHAEVDRRVEAFPTTYSPTLGARMVARAWRDADFAGRLLDDAGAAAAELGHGGMSQYSGVRLYALANTPAVHNVVVCTLCSCYPIAWFGPPPAWYKSEAYRSRVVVDPRGVLAGFGTVLGDDVEVRVWDSTAEARYLVVPMRPDGAETLSEEEQCALVTRDCLIGTAVPRVGG